MRVWAPHAGRVDLVMGDERVAMDPGPRGWHVVERDPAPGTDYGFALDGGDPLPDPRSPWQPHGVRGLSRAVDHRAFGWTDAGWDAGDWLRSGVLYELHVGTFSPEGTFDGAAGQLGHLAELGVAALELMPVAQFPGSRGWGYDGVDLWAPHHAYGGPDGLKRLVEACHRHGLAVVLDVVYNHLGPDGNNLARFGPYFTDRYATPWGDAVNVDGQDSDEVRAFFIDNALMWLRDYHFDGLRLDAVHAITDRSAVHLLEEIAVRVSELGAELGRSLVVIAESDLNDPRLVRDRSVGGYGLDAQWNDDFHHALHAVLTGERVGYYQDFGSLGDLAKTVTDKFLFDGQYSEFRRRRHGRPATDVPHSRFLAYLQNHDQVGNRAAGDRSAHLLSEDRLRVAAAIVLLSPFVPMLFQGEEWGASTPFQYFTDHEDPSLAQAVSRGRRHEFEGFGWAPSDVPDPQARDTFTRSCLDWSEVGRAPHGSLLAWHRELLALRAGLDRDGSVICRWDAEGNWFVLDRGGAVVVAALAGATIALEGPAELALASHPDISLDDGAIRLPADSVAVLRRVAGASPG